MQSNYDTSNKSLAQPGHSIMILYKTTKTNMFAGKAQTVDGKVTMTLKCPHQISQLKFQLAAYVQSGSRQSVAD